MFRSKKKNNITFFLFFFLVRLNRTENTEIDQSCANAVKDSRENICSIVRSNTANTSISKSFRVMGLQMFKHLSRLNPVFTAIFERESNRFLKHASYTDFPRVTK